MAAVTVSKGRWNASQSILYGIAKGSFSPLTIERTGSGEGSEEEEELVHPHQVSTRSLTKDERGEELRQSTPPSEHQTWP